MARALRRGGKLEELGCPAEAEIGYEEALASIEDEPTAFETSLLMHRIGSCALELEDGPCAFASFVDAGRRAKDIGMRQLCAESLAAAGWCLATYVIETPVAEAVDRDLVTTGFDGVLEEAREVLLVDGKPSFGHAMAVHSRFAGLMILSTEAFLDEASSLAAEGLVHDVMTPFLTLHDVSGRTTADESVVTAYRTGALVRLCRALGEQGRQHRMGAPATRDAIADMARHVSNAFVRETREPMWWWLGSYLRRHRETDWTADDHLLVTAGE